jgi:hypothetical protein
MECSTCGNDTAHVVCIQFLNGIREEHCDKCNNVRPTYYRDALGNRVKVTDDVIGKYSYAIDAPITSQRQFAETLRRNNLAQREA